MQHPEISGGEPLVPLLDEADFSPRMRRSAERAIARSGRLPNSGYALANAGDLGAATREFFEEVWALGQLPQEFRLLIRYKVSTLNSCLYCSTHQVSFLRKLGVEWDKIEHIHEFESHLAFGEKERAGLAFAEALTIDASNIPEPLNKRFTAAFTPAERVEVVVLAAAMGFLNKVNDSLRIPIEDEVLDIAISVQNLTSPNTSSPTPTE